MPKYRIYRQVNYDLTAITETEAANADAAIGSVATESDNGCELVAIPERYVRPRVIVVESNPKITLVAVSEDS